MSTIDLHLRHPGTAPPAAARAAQVIAVGPLGALVGVAAIAFTIAAGPLSLSLGDWLVAAWALATAVVNLVAGIALGRGSETARRILIATALAHVAFSVVKLTAYDEPEALVFAALDAALIALLSLRGVRRSCTRDLR
jgi:hypothetical protein